MARPGTPYETVKDICNRLASDGLRPSYRLVAAELEGNPSKKTVLEHIDQWRTEQKSAATVPGLSETAVTAFKAEIAAHVQTAQETLETELDELKESNREALEALEVTEDRNTVLENEVKELKDQLAAQQQEHERITAGANSTIENLNQQVTDLQKERDQLIKSGEAARTEAARAQLQLDQAVKAVTSAEKRETGLNAKIETLTTEKIESEKTAAVATAHVEELKTLKTENKDRIKEHKTEISELSKELKERDVENKKEVSLLTDKLEEVRKQQAATEQRAAVLEAATVKSKTAEVKK